MSEIEIKQIDVLVHPDYHLIWEDTESGFNAQQSLRARWDSRIVNLAKDGDGILFYYSGIPLSPHILYEGITINEDLKKEEQLRLRRYQDLLGDRFICFSSPWEEPNAEFLQSLLKKRGLKYRPSSTLLTAYGEYLDLCVISWQEATGEALFIPYKNYSVDANLSVKHGIGGLSFPYELR
jgi:hypothetical protein